MAQCFLFCQEFFYIFLYVIFRISKLSNLTDIICQCQKVRKFEFKHRNQDNLSNAVDAEKINWISTNMFSGFGLGI